MPRVRRPAFTFLYLHDGSFLDVEALLRGEARPAPLQQLLALSLLTGDEVPITRADVDLLSAVPPDEWVDADALGEPDRVAALTSAGLLVADSSEPRPAELRRRDEQLRRDEWNAYAALYHFMTRWRDVDVGLDPSQAEVPPPEAVEEFVRSHGAPPETFHAARNVRATDPLPAQPLDGALGGALARRATTRRFDPEARLTRDELGRGAFVTAAINGETIEDRLGLDGFAEGALLVSGCGRPARDGGPPWRPYVPRQTRLPSRQAEDRC